MVISRAFLERWILCALILVATGGGYLESIRRPSSIDIAGELKADPPENADLKGSNVPSSAEKEGLVAARVRILERLSRLLEWEAANRDTPMSVRKSRVVLPPVVFRNGVAVVQPGEFSFYILSKDHLRRPRTGCVDAFFVMAQGHDGTRSGGRVTCELENSGRYSVSLLLPFAGAYVVNVTASGTINSSVCFELGHEGSVVAMLNVLVMPSEPQRGGDQSADISESTPNTNAADCSAEAFFRGTFRTELTEWTAQYVFANRSSKYAWRPYPPTAELCDWPARWSMARLKGLLGGKWLFFLGDSTLEEIAIAYYIKFYGRFDAAWNNPRCHCNATKFISQRIWDTGHISPDLPRLSFYWIGNADPCQNGGGLETLDNDTVQQDLRALFGNAFLTDSSPTLEKKVDLLLFNTGLHDLKGRIPFNFPLFFHRLDLALGNLSSIARTAVWKTLSPKLHALTCRFFYGTQPHVDVINAIASPLARSHGFQIADQYTMNIAMPDFNQGHHCRSMVPCDAFAAALLNFMPPPPQIASHVAHASTQRQFFRY